MALLHTGPGALDAVLLTHDHYDHVKGVLALCSRGGITLYASRSTIRSTGLARTLAEGQVRELRPDLEVEIAGFLVRPFAVPHDTFTMGFRLHDGSSTVGIATDLGSVTLDALSCLSRCDAVVIEANHDEELLQRGPYPAHLKRRISSPLGHLSNTEAAGLVRSIRHDRLRHLVLAHLSRTNNTPELSLRAAGDALREFDGEVSVSLGRHDRPGELLTV